MKETIIQRLQTTILRTLPRAHGPAHNSNADDVREFGHGARESTKN